MNSAPDAAAGAYEPLFDLFEFQRPFYTTWLRSTRAALEMAVGGQRLLSERGLALVSALAEAQPGAQFPFGSSQQAWRTLLEWWAAGPIEVQHLVRGALTEMQFSADELVAEIGREQEAHQHTRAERDRARERIERELAARRQAEHERGEAQARVEELEAEQRRLERTRQRLERELAEHKARLEQVEHERDQQRERADGERTERLRLERAPAQSERPTAGSSADKPAVNVVRREDDWAVVREDAKRASGVFETKREAVERAREIARHDGADVHVQPVSGNGSSG